MNAVLAVLAGLAVLILAVSSALAQPVGWVYVDPACPAPSDRVTFRVATGDYRFVATVTQTGNVFRFVVSYPEGFWAEPVFYPVTVTVEPLAAGNYRVENFRRIATAPGVYGPETFWGATDFVVQENPPSCTPRRITAVSSAMITGIVGQQYDQPMVVQVVDAHGLPVSGASVRWNRVQRDYWRSDLPAPDIVGIPTAAPGTYAYTATANSVPGTFLYRAFIEYADEQPSAYFVISNREARDTTLRLPVVEYWHPVLNHYFITSSSAEMAKLDDGTIAGWYRTGGAFLAFDSVAADAGSAGPVCRFYGRPEAGLTGHFYSVAPEECEAVRQRFGTAWIEETRNAFGAIVPDFDSGACPEGTQPLYRAYNNQSAANHRYAISRDTLAHTLSQNGAIWISEGYGPDAVAMCVPR